MKLCKRRRVLGGRGLQRNHACYRQAATTELLIDHRLFLTGLEPACFVKSFPDLLGETTSVGVAVTISTAIASSTTSLSLETWVGAAAGFSVWDSTFSSSVKRVTLDFTTLLLSLCFIADGATAAADAYAGACVYERPSSSSSSTDSQTGSGVTHAAGVVAADDRPDMGAEKGALLLLKLKDERPDEERLLMVEAAEEATVPCMLNEVFPSCIGGRVIAGMGLKPRIDTGGFALSVELGDCLAALGELSPRSDASDARRELG